MGSDTLIANILVITFRASRRRREMYIGHEHLSVCVSVCMSNCLSIRRRIPTLLHGTGCKLGNGRGWP